MVTCPVEARRGLPQLSAERGQLLGRGHGLAAGWDLTPTVADAPGDAFEHEAGPGHAVAEEGGGQHTHGSRSHQHHRERVQVVGRDEHGLSGGESPCADGSEGSQGDDGYLHSHRSTSQHSKGRGAEHSREGSRSSRHQRELSGVGRAHPERPRDRDQQDDPADRDQAEATGDHGSHR